MLLIGVPGFSRVYVLPSAGAMGMVFVNRFVGKGEDQDFQNLVNYIEDNTVPDEIIHVDPSNNYLGNRIFAASGRRVDVGGFASEVRNRKMVEIVEAFRNSDTDCLFIYENRDIPKKLNCQNYKQIGRFRIGIRGKIQNIYQRKMKGNQIDNSQ